MRLAPKLVVPVGASAAIVLLAPFAGQLRAILREAFPGRFATIVAGAVLAAALLAVLTALFRIRHDRARRYGLIVGALAFATAYTLATATGRPDVDAVERVHFVEYGVLTWLYYRAVRPARDLSVLLLPVLAGLIVGTVEEWFQWFIPNRVGEARDVFLNLAAVGCGLLFSLGVEPPGTLAFGLGPSSRRRVAYASAAAVLVFAIFVDVVHFGFDVSHEHTTFKSRYSAAQLGALSQDRSASWLRRPPTVLRRISREDQFMDEGLWHIRRRNEAWDAGDFRTAWHENRILEEFFAPVLDTPSYAVPVGARWPAAQRADGEQQGAAPASPYVSHAEPYPILTRWKGVFRSAAGLIVLALLAGKGTGRHDAATRRPSRVG
jgi:VanZ family protein